MVTYSEREARIASSETRYVSVPVPPGARVQAVEIVPHEGKAGKWSAILKGTGDSRRLEMKVEDCGDRALYYRVRYRLG